MPKVWISCRYCGREWTEVLYSQSQVEDLKCPRCNDSSLTVKNKEAVDNSNCFGYDLEDKKDE